MSTENDLMQELGLAEATPAETSTEKDLLEEEKTEETAVETEKTEEEPVEEPAQDEPTEPTEEEPAQEEKAEEPVEEPVEEPTEETPQQELILGKFKTQEDLVNAYQNLEKQYSKKAQQFSEYSKVATPDEFDKRVEDAIGKASWDLVDNAMKTISDPEHLKEATFALEQFKRTGDIKHLETARGFLDKRVDRKLEVDFMNTSAEIRQEANKYRDEIELQPVAEALTALENEDPEWLKDETHQNIMVEAIKLNKKVDVKGIKKLIKEVEDRAVQRYMNSEKRKAVVKEEKKTVNPIKTPDIVEPKRTKPEFMKTTEDFLKEEFGL